MSLTIGRLDSGLQYILSNDKCLQTITVFILVRVGSRNESCGEYGMAHFLEHMLFEGTKRRPTPKNITSDIHGIGGVINAYTAQNVTAYYIKVGKDYADCAFDVLADILYNSKFTQSNVAKEKRIVVSELGKADQIKILNSEGIKLIFRGTQLAHLVGGDPMQIQRFSRDSVVDFFEREYCDDNIVLSLVGNFNKKGVVKELNRAFSKNLKCSKSVSPPYYSHLIQRQMRYRNIIQQGKQAYILFGFPGYAIGTDEAATLELIGTLLAGNMSSRLFGKLRSHKGITYSVRKETHQFRDVGDIRIFWNTYNDPVTIKKSSQIVWRELDRLTKEFISEEELIDTRKYMEGRLTLEKENTLEVAELYAYSQLLLGKPLRYSDLIRQYRKITRADVRRVSKNVFQKGKLSLVIISDKKVGNPFL